MPQPPVGPLRDQAGARNDDHAERPERAEREDRPPFQQLRGREEERPREHDGEGRAGAQRAFDKHQQERTGVGDEHEPVNVPGRLNTTPGPLPALVRRGTPRLDQHGAKHDREEDKRLCQMKKAAAQNDVPPPQANSEPGC